MSDIMLIVEDYYYFNNEDWANHQDIFRHTLEALLYFFENREV